MRTRALFIAATGQNVGKTTTSLGIMAGLQQRYQRVGFIKPVGQLHVKVSETLNVDKDAVLFKEVFGLKTDYRDISPVIIPAGFSRRFLEGDIPISSLKKTIQESFQRVVNAHDYTIVEGTGHIGVGAIVDLNNAQIAAELGVEMVIIASGGLGSAIDTLALNLAMCEKHGVKVRGVILNRVLPEKRQMILDYFPKALESFGLPLIGCIPYCGFLSIPTMEDFELLFNTQLLSGQQYRYSHFREPRLVAGSLRSYLGDMRKSELVITPASRDEIIDAILDHKDEHKVGLLLTGREPPSLETLSKIKASDIPALYAPVCSYDAMKQITSFTAKIRRGDKRKVEKAIALITEHVDFHALCDNS